MSRFLTYLKYALLGLLLLSIALLATLPARVALGWIEPEKWPLSVHHIQGTIWRGQAAIAMQDIRVESVHWSFSWLDVLRARLGYQIHFNTLGGQGQARIALTGSEQLVLDDVQFKLPLNGAAVQALLPVPLGGFMHLAIEHLELTQGKLVALDGQINWDSAQVMFEPAMLLGDLQADLQTEQDQIQIVFADKGGPLQIKGRLFALSPGNWNVQAKIKPRDQASSDLQATLNMLGRAAPDGSVNISQRLKLPF